MKRAKTIFCMLLPMLFAFATAQAQWKIYDCSTLPVDADTAWHETGDEPDEVTAILSLVEDPEIEGNMLIKVDENVGTGQEMWRHAWNVDPNVGGTLVFRGIDLDASSYDAGFDVYIHNTVVRERFLSKNGNRIALNKWGQEVPLNTTEWHIYRITILGDFIEVFVDEDPLSYLGVQGEAIAEGENYFMFGDNGSRTIGCYYDWFIWDDTGAYAPGQGTPIPEALLETGSMPTSVETKGEQIPEAFTLEQNYPNPFNPSTEISFSLTKKGYTVLNVYNTLGQLVNTLVEQDLNAGKHSVVFDALGLNSGVYYYQIRSGGFTEGKKMILLK